MITFLRRKNLGAGSCRGMARHIDNRSDKLSAITYLGENCSIIRNDKVDYLPETDLLVRWGCTSPTSVPLSKQMNTSVGIQAVSDKMEARKWYTDYAPETFFNVDDAVYPCVIRPAFHHQGRNLFVAHDLDELREVLCKNAGVLINGWYGSKLINKVAEYRVYVMCGRVITVAKKTPGDPSQIAWNVAQGGRFDVLSWGNWPIDACRVAVQAANLFYPHLHFSGVDIMVDTLGQPFVLELNSAPSLPLLSSGDVSYRQQCMAKGFLYHEKNGLDLMGLSEGTHWKDYIHPAIHEEKE